MNPVELDHCFPKWCCGTREAYQRKSYVHFTERGQNFIVRVYLELPDPLSEILMDTYVAEVVHLWVCGPTQGWRV